MTAALSAMDFTNRGAIERAGSAFRAQVQWYDKGANRHIPGPWRPDEEAAYLEPTWNLPGTYLEATWNLPGTCL